MSVEERVKILFEQIHVPLTLENANEIAEQKKVQEQWREKQLDAVLSKIVSCQQTGLGFVKLCKHEKPITDILQKQGFRILDDVDGYGIIHGYIVCWDLNKYYELVCGQGYDIEHLNEIFP